MEREVARRWLVGHQAAERRHLQAMRAEGPLDAETSFAAALELCDLVDAGAPDPLRERQVAVARAAWARLRAWAASRA